ncbi:MAG: hypothetical protein QG622_2286 [Actinomycetota bacterium]|nr:hypothetical protein [Actinomycetota bacterium]
MPGSQSSGDPAVLGPAPHPNLVRGRFLNRLAALQNTNRAQVCVVRVVFRTKDGRHTATLTLRRDAAGTGSRDGEVSEEVTLPLEDRTDDLPRPDGETSWTTPVDRYSRLLAGRPDPVQVYTGLLHEAGSQVAVLFDVYPGVRLTLEEIALTGPSEASIRTLDPDGTRYLTRVGLGVVHDLVGIDYRIAEWVCARRSSPPVPAGPREILMDWR